jgi:hypothetical protein
LSSETVFFAVVVGYVGVVVWCLAFDDSLQPLTRRIARLRRRLTRWRERLPRVETGDRRYVAGAVGGAILAALIAAGVVPNLGSKGKVGPLETPGLRSADHAPAHPSRAFTPPSPSDHRQRSVHTGQDAKAPAVRRPPARHTKVVSNLVSVSARVPATSTTVSTQVPHGSGPAPLPAPAGSSAPTPMPEP